MIDGFGREIKSVITKNGTRYFSVDNSINFELKTKDDVKALDILNSNPPPKFQEIEKPESHGGNELLKSLESLTPKQKSRLKQFIQNL